MTSHCAAVLLVSNQRICVHMALLLAFVVVCMQLHGCMPGCQEGHRAYNLQHVVGALASICNIVQSLLAQTNNIDDITLMASCERI